MTSRRYLDKALLYKYIIFTIHLLAVVFFLRNTRYILNMGLFTNRLARHSTELSNSKKPLSDKLNCVYCISFTRSPLVCTWVFCLFFSDTKSHKRISVIFCFQRVSGQLSVPDALPWQPLIVDAILNAVVCKASIMYLGFPSWLKFYNWPTENI